MKKLLAAIFVVLSFLLIRQAFVVKVYDVTSKSLKEPPVTTIAPPPHFRPVTPVRLPAQVRSFRPRNPDLSKTFTRDQSYNVGKSFVFATDVGALPKNEYSPRFGELLYEDKSWSYFKKAQGEQFIPVAYHPSKNKFYPISSVLQLKKVTPDLRSELLNEGHQEYHYLKNLKLLFIESTHEEVLKTYEQFKRRGLIVELEVLSETAKAH